MGLFSKFKKDTPLPLELGQLSVLAITNSASSLEPILSSLTQFNHRAGVVHTVAAFIEALGTQDPDVILISVNLKNTDVMKIITVLQSLDIPSIVFGEEEDEATFLKLLGTEIRHTLLPPVSFEAFMERVEFLAMEKDLNPEKNNGIVIKIGGSKPQWGKLIHLLREKLLGSVHFSAPTQTPSEEASINDLMPVDEKDLRVGNTLDVDLFISMPLNHKCILYLRKGHILLKENLDRLGRFSKERILKRRPA